MSRSGTLEPISSLRIANLSLEFPAILEGATPAVILRNFGCYLDFQSRHVRITGPNGIGKSVFGKVLAGYQAPRTGDISINNAPAAPLNRANAKTLGIEYIPQFLPRSIDTSAAELLWSNSIARHARLYSRKAIRKAFQQLADNYGVNTGLVDLSSLFVPLSELSPLDRLSFFLLDAILAGNRLIILDEPTAALSYSEANDFHRQIHELATDATTRPRFMMISHPAQFEPDEFTSYRFSLETLTHAPTREKLDISPAANRIRSDRGHSISLTYGKATGTTTTTLLAGDVCVVVGPATTEFKALPHLLHDEICSKISAQNTQLDVRFLPEGSNDLRIVRQLPVTENLAIDFWDRPEWLERRFFLSESRLVSLHVVPSTRDYGIHPSDHKNPVGLYSGGNRQKIVLARMLFGQPAIVILVDAFKGLDDANIRRVARLLETKAANGTTFVIFAYERGPEEALANFSLRFDGDSLKGAEVV